eukprot:SM003735S13711  [mRNA]  locus=s3735:199:1271:- [translate_table: standard]
MAWPAAKVGRTLAPLAVLGVEPTTPRSLSGATHIDGPAPLPVVYAAVPAPACERLECPPYSVAHAESDFEVRRYRAATWVITGPLPDVSFERAILRGFHRLFQYIQGANVNSSRVEMTAPVATAVLPSAGPFCSSAFAVGLYVPAKWGRHPPVPLDELELTVRPCASLPAFFSLTPPP